MVNKTIIIISTMVDATIKEYQPDVDFKMFRSVEGLEQHLLNNPIRADILFLTKDAVSSPTATFSFLMTMLRDNNYIKVDRVIYVTENNSPELEPLNYLITDNDLDTWEIIQGGMNRSFIQEVINGTFREDSFNVNRKVVVRKPRADYVKQQLKHMDSLNEDYVDDDHELMDIEDEDIPVIDVEIRQHHLERVYISGIKSKERTAFSLLVAQYLSRNSKVLILESDPDYHLVTEYITKSEIPCTQITVTDIYDDLPKALDNIRKAESPLVAVTCIDRIPFSYKFLSMLLYYNLMDDFDYIICESDIEDIPHATPMSIVIPSTIPDVLAAGELIDKAEIPYCRFVGVDMQDLPEVHVSSGLVLSTILNDILTDTSILCPVISITSLRLDGTIYDLGSILGRSALL